MQKPWYYVPLVLWLFYVALSKSRRYFGTCTSGGSP